MVRVFISFLLLGFKKNWHGQLKGEGSYYDSQLKGTVHHSEEVKATGA